MIYDHEIKMLWYGVDKAKAELRIEILRFIFWGWMSVITLTGLLAYLFSWGIMQ